jgi:hypothetical protein
MHFYAFIHKCVHNAGEPPSTRMWHAATMAGRDQMVVCGGTSREGADLLGDVYILKLSTRRWEHVRDMAAPHGRGVCKHSIMSCGDLLFVWGGWDGHACLGGDLGCTTLLQSNAIVQKLGGSARSLHSGGTVETESFDSHTCVEPTEVGRDMTVWDSSRPLTLDHVRNVFRDTYHERLQEIEELHVGKVRTCAHVYVLVYASMYLFMYHFCIYVCI